MSAVENWTPVSGLLHFEQVQPDKVYMNQPVNGEVTTYTWAQTADQVRRMAAYLVSLDLPPGSRIGLVSRNCAHVIMADLAIWMAGHVSLPIYPSLNADTLAYILEHSEARLLFLGPLDDWPAMQPGAPDSLPIVRLPGAAQCTAGHNVQEWDELVADQTPLAQPVERDQEEMARLMYTSGSTGQPKGVMVPFRAMRICSTLLNTVVEIGPDDRQLSYLPLAHAFESGVVLVSSMRFGYEVFFSEGLHTFVADLQRARPTLFHSVPRLWVKFQQAVFSKLPAEKLDALLADEATAEATRKQVLTNLGLQDCRIAITGSAPLAPAIQQWYRDLGLELLEGYGMTEDLIYSHISHPGRARIGYVGEANAGVGRRIASNGEVQLNSPAKMLGYYKEPQKTAEAFTEDGWFRTGDLGEVDEQGRLKITGRLKELFKTSKGKYVAPAPIENRMGHELIEVACVSGANQPQPFVLLLPSEPALERIKSGGQAEVEQAINDLLGQVNTTVDPHEALAFAVVVSEPWTIDNGMLTPTMKIKRNVIEERYADKVDSWYAHGAQVIFESAHGH